MLQCFLLQVAHDVMGSVDRLRHTRAIPMFGGDRGGQPAIIGRHLRLQRPAACGKALFQRMDAPFLIGVEGQLLMEQRMNLALHVRRGGQPGPRHQHRRQRSEKCNQRDQPVTSRRHWPSNRDGA